MNKELIREKLEAETGIIVSKAEDMFCDIVMDSYYGDRTILLIRDVETNEFKLENVSLGATLMGIQLGDYELISKVNVDTHTQQEILDGYITEEFVLGFLQGEDVPEEDIHLMDHRELLEVCEEHEAFEDYKGNAQYSHVRDEAELSLDKMYDDIQDYLNRL